MSPAAPWTPSPWSCCLLGPGEGPGQEPTQGAGVLQAQNWSHLLLGPGERTPEPPAVTRAWQEGWGLRGPGGPLDVPGSSRGPTSSCDHLHHHFWGWGCGKSSLWNLTPKQAPFSHIRPHSVRKESGKHSPFPMLILPCVGSEAPCSDHVRILPSGLSPGFSLPIQVLAHSACPTPFPGITALGSHLPPGLHPGACPAPLA